MVKSDFSIGQTVYLKVISGSNAARYIDRSNSEEWIKEKVVSKIGRKYISVASAVDSPYGEIKFDIANNFCQHYTVGGADYELYLTKEDIEQDRECEHLYDEIKSAFSGRENNRKYSLEQLKKIKEIIS